MEGKTRGAAPGDGRGPAQRSRAGGARRTVGRHAIPPGNPPRGARRRGRPGEPLAVEPHRARAAVRDGLVRAHWAALAGAVRERRAELLDAHPAHVASRGEGWWAAGWRDPRSGARGPAPPPRAAKGARAGRAPVAAAAPQGTQSPAAILDASPGRRASSR